MTNGAPDSGAYRTIMRIAAIVSFIYGIGFLLFPELQFQMSQDPSAVGPGWVRWAGGVLIGVAAAEWLASGGPTKQRPLVFGLGICYLLTALALLYSALSGEYQGVAWYIWVPIIINAAYVLAFGWVAQRYKTVL